jgi:formate hydrogenlyase subunit 3/multisubunit Na+/H+ antiporter MnhD subunit
MRALIGAIIAAGALIGLGLTNLGIGLRYQTEGRYDMKFKEIDNPLQYGVIFLSILALVGLAVAFVGLAYHHERRFRESQLGVRAPESALPP